MWLIRHAESSWNAEGRWQGQSDPGLSATGRAQAEQLAEQLVDAAIELLVTSDLRRAYETAAPLARRLGLTARREPRLREIEAGAWSGLTHAEIEARDGRALARFRSGDLDARVGGGESRREAAARARAALCELALEGQSDHIAVVTHGGVVQSLFADVRLANTHWKLIDVPACFQVPATPPQPDESYA
jgi:probable phosphoglycerate mutase